MSQNNIPCTICRKPKHELKAKKSKVLPGVPMYACQTCLSAGLEPRGFIILAARRHMKDGDLVELAKVQKYIKKNKYLGEKILAEDLM